MPETIIPTARIRQEDQTFVHGIARCYATADWSEEELISVTADVLRVIRQVAGRYSDPSCVELNQLELESEGRKKFIQRLESGVLNEIRDRTGLFKHLTTCFNNLVRAIVGKCRFTAKRMGRSNPPKGSKIEKYNKSFKPEVSIEAACEDEYMNPAVQRAASIEDSKVLSDFDIDMQELLTDVEFLVYRQITRPNNIALTLSEMDANRGHRTKRVLSVDITQANLAMGIGLSLEHFETVVSQIRAKTKSYMNNNNVEQSYNTAVVALEKFFDVHVPRSTEPLVVRRVFTMKARADYLRMTPEIEDLLKLVGARPPSVDKSGVLNCYGILWQANHPICRACDLYDSCKVEAASFGLDGVALSPKILPARGMVRTATRDGTPFIVPGEINDVGPSVPENKPAKQNDPSTLATNSKEAHLLAFLEENFFGFYIYGERYYSYASSKGQQVGQAYLFRVCQKKGQMRVRFCDPSDKLKLDLETMNSIHYLPYETAFKASVRLLERHAEEMLSGKKPAEDSRRTKQVSPAKKSTAMVTISPVLDAALESNYRGFLLRGDKFYCPKKQVGRGMRYLFWRGDIDGQERIRFCKPADNLLGRLEKIGKFHYLRTTEPEFEACTLLLAHSGTTRPTLAQRLLATLSGIKKSLTRHG